MGTTMGAELSLESPDNPLCTADRMGFANPVLWYNCPVALDPACFRRQKGFRKLILITYVLEPSHPKHCHPHDQQETHYDFYLYFICLSVCFTVAFSF